MKIITKNPDIKEKEKQCSQYLEYELYIVCTNFTSFEVGVSAPRTGLGTCSPPLDKKRHEHTSRGILPL